MRRRVQARRVATLLAVAGAFAALTTGTSYADDPAAFGAVQVAGVTPACPSARLTYTGTLAVTLAQHSDGRLYRDEVAGGTAENCGRGLRVIAEVTDEGTAWVGPGTDAVPAVSNSKAASCLGCPSVTAVVTNSVPYVEPADPSVRVPTLITVRLYGYRRGDGVWHQFDCQELHYLVEPATQEYRTTYDGECDVQVLVVPDPVATTDG
jgi:hypothetical protein